MRRTWLFTASWLLIFLCSLPAGVAAQGVQSGTVRGVVKDQQGRSMPGVVVTVESSALQGARTDVTARDGLYVFTALPPGAYTIRFALSPFTPVERTVTLPLGLVVEQNVTMVPSGVSAEVNVVATMPAPIATPIVGANFTNSEINSLATSRTLSGIAELAPGLTDVTPNSGQVSINGAFAFDNVFMINGVDVNDNLFGSPQNLFIEDAIQETQVLTSGISAEYGRFSGGVINAVTKSGGNTFSGTARLDFTNPSWSTETPFEVSNGTTHTDTLNRTWEGTLGGPLVRDHLWFFTAGRYNKQSLAGSLDITGYSVHAGQRRQARRSQADGLDQSGPHVHGRLRQQPASPRASGRRSRSASTSTRSTTARCPTATTTRTTTACSARTSSRKPPTRSAS